MTLNAVVAVKSGKASITGRYHQPPEGSPASGDPLATHGIQPGTSNDRRRSPSAPYQGRK
jgi:hypothetical protein